MPIPPTYQNQTVRHSLFKLQDIETDELILNSKVIDKNAFQPVSLISYQPPPKQSFRVKYRVDADIYKMEMKSFNTKDEALEFELKNKKTNYSPKDTETIGFEPISKIELERYKRKTSKINYGIPEFKKFIEKIGLHRKQIPILETSSSNITSLESILSFAYRVSLYLKIHHKYSKNVNETIKNQGGNYGSLSHLVSAILRYNNIPTRLLIGIVTNIEISERKHGKIEFYNEDVGLWFPYDPPEITTTDPFYKLNFANDPAGNFLTYHIDPIFDIPNEIQDIPYLVGARVKYTYNKLLSSTPPIVEMDYKYTVKRIQI